MARRKIGAATALVLSVLVVVSQGCGGTLEGKYRRGEITTTTTTSTTATSGNAAGQRVQGARMEPQAGGTIAGSATGRIVLSSLGGRHR